MAVIVGGSALPNSASAVVPGSRAARARAVPSAATCAGVTPGRIRAMAPKICSEMLLPSSLCTCAMCDGIHTCVSRSGKANAAGMTPTTV